MRYEWFRWYHSTVRDAKLRDLLPEVRWVWPAILTLASESKCRGTIKGAEATIHHLAYTAAVAEDVAQRALTVFIERKMVKAINGGLMVPRFRERQYDYPSDVPTKRRSRRGAVVEKRRSVSGVRAEKSRRPRGGSAETEDRIGEKKQKGLGLKDVALRAQGTPTTRGTGPEPIGAIMQKAIERDG